MLDINLIKAWLAYMDIELIDIFLFIGLILLIVMGLYIAIKKNLFLGIGQIILTLFTPYFICVFLNAHKEFWEIEKKRWVTLFVPNDYTSNNNSFTAIMILILVPLFVFMTIKCLNVLLKKEDHYNNKV